MIQEKGYKYYIMQEEKIWIRWSKQINLSSLRGMSRMRRLKN